MPTLDLSKAVQDILETYGNDVKDAAERALIEVKQEAMLVMRANSPVGHGKHAGRYKAGWTTTELQAGFGRMEIVVYNKTDWNLTHLLNDGFYSVRAGRRIPGDHHIDTAEKEINEALMKKMEKNL